MKFNAACLVLTISPGAGSSALTHSPHIYKHGAANSPPQKLANNTTRVQIQQKVKFSDLLKYSSAKKTIFENEQLPSPEMVKHTILASKPSDRTDSKFKGVRKRKWGKWVSEIRLPNCRERIWLGSYDSAAKAARAFDAALFCLRGRTAKFNFPDNPPEIEGGRSLSPPEIQVAAARHANLEPPKAESEHALTDQSASESQVASPCPSVVSDGTAQLGSNELALHGSFLDLLMDSNVGSGVHSAEYGIFSGFDDFFPPQTQSVNYEEENIDSVLVEDSFLWNF